MGSKEIPRDFPVKVLEPGAPAKDRMTCNTCGRSWDDAIATSYTPTPAARCPFEAWHKTEIPINQAKHAIKIFEADFNSNDVEEDDGGQAKIFEMGDGKGLFVRLHSYDEDRGHQEFDSLVGKRVRIVVEVIG